jgi:hypothetical protein
MKFFRKNLFTFATVAFLSFISVLAVEGSHHHDNLESHNNCSFCAWQVTGSSAASVPTPPLLPDVLVFIALFTFAPFFVSAFKSFPSLGRAPPPNLL